MLSEKEIVSLIKMLDDPDVAISSSIISTLSNTDKKTIPLMEEIWELSMDSLVRAHIQTITATIIENEAISFFKKWKSEPNVLKAWMYLNELCHPEFSQEDTLNFMNKIRFDAWIEMNENQSTLEKCNILSIVLQKRILSKITLNKENSSETYLISNIAKTSIASQTAAAVIFQELASQLEIQLFGLNVFEYAILGYLNPSNSFETNFKQEDVLFYIIFSDKISFIGNHQLDFGKNSDDINNFKMASPIETFEKIIYGLIQSYRKEGNNILEKLCVKIYKTITES